MCPMAATGIDKFLKGVDDLQRADAAEIDQKIAALEDELSSIRVKLAVLKELRKQPRRPAPAAATEPRVVAVTGTGETISEGTGTVEVHRPHTWKRDAILEIVTQQPGRVWTATEVRDELRRRGVMEGDPGTPTRAVLRRMSDAGEVQKIGTATYTYAGETLVLNGSGA